jgi:hypothetical protein
MEHGINKCFNIGGKLRRQDKRTPEERSGINRHNKRIEHSKQNKTQ